MLSNFNLKTLVRGCETIIDRESDLGISKNVAHSNLNKNLAEPIISYLLEPYESGYWELKAEWNVASPLARYLLDVLHTTEDLEKESISAMLPSLLIARKISDEKRTELLRVTNRVSSIVALFRAAKADELGVDGPRLSEWNQWISRINFAELRQKFSAAYEIFSQQIYFEGINNNFELLRAYQIKTGLMALMSAPKEEGLIHVVAINKDQLFSLREFYNALGVIENSTIQRIFAPDEALFRPYFTFVSSVLNHVIHDNQISYLFSQALAYYEEDDFQHCISSLGLIAEDYIQRVYTTLLREALPGNHTLGQILERLSRRLEDYVSTPKLTLRSVDSAFDLIKALPVAPDSAALSPALRELIQIIQDDRHYFSKRIDELSKPPNRRTVFPSKVGDALSELLKWRNAASHNSRIPLGAHEADRTLFCLVTLINWWQKQLATLDWSASRIAIIEILIAASKNRDI